MVEALLISAVNNRQQQKCTLHILNHDELVHSPLLRPLVQMENIAYARSLHQPVLPPTTRRYASIEQYLGDSGEGATTFVLTSSKFKPEFKAGAETVPVIYGAVSIAPYIDSELPPGNVAVPPARREFKWAPQRPAADATLEARWLLCCLAVSPAVQRQGIAGRLVALAEAYAVAQSRSRGNGKVVRVRVMLSCIKETTGEFYLLRGYRVVEERRMPRGFFGSDGGFTIWFMDKVIESEMVGSQDSEYVP